MRQIAFPWSHIKSKPDSTTQLSNIACYNSNRMKQEHNKNDDVTNIVVNRRSMQMRFPGRTTTASHSLHFILLSTQHKAAVGALFPVIWHQGAKKNHSLPNMNKAKSLNLYPRHAKLYAYWSRTWVGTIQTAKLMESTAKP